MTGNRDALTDALPAPGRSACGAYGAFGGRAMVLVLALLLLPASGWPAQQDICENKSGPELIRCIEAAARGAPPAAPKGQGQSQPAASPAAGSTASVPAAKGQASPARDTVHPAPEDCTGKTGEILRRCLAAGGRLSPDAAVIAAPPPSPGTVARVEPCDNKTGEELRRCVEAAAKAPQAGGGIAASPGSTHAQIIPCTGYAAADQPLCVHRNAALAECRNRQAYPDFDVCLRSFMIRAPQPARADCSALQARTRTQCEARNQVFQACAGDKLAYFSCLEQKLGADARLTRR